MQERVFQIKARIIWVFLRIQIAWLRFRLLKPSPQEYIYTPPHLYFYESGFGIVSIPWGRSPKQFFDDSSIPKRRLTQTITFQGGKNEDCEKE